MEVSHFFSSRKAASQSSSQSNGMFFLIMLYSGLATRVKSGTKLDNRKLARRTSILPKRSFTVAN